MQKVFYAHSKGSEVMRSLQAKLRMSVALFVLISVIVLSTLMLFIFYRNDISQMQENVTSNAQAYKTAVEHKMGIFKKELELSGQYREITDQSLTVQQRSSILDEKVKATEYNYISVADKDGKTYRNSEIAERDYFKSALEDVTYISSPVINKVDGKLTVMVGAKINNGGSVPGVVYGGIDYNEFSQLISNIKIGEKGYGFIVDKAGTIIAHPDTSLVENMTNFIEQGKTDTEYSQLGGIISEMTNGNSGSGFYNFQGVRRYIVYLPISGPEGWSLGITLPVSQALSAFYLTLLIGVILTLLLLAVAFVLSGLLAKGIAKPIITTIERIELLSQGDLHTEVVRVPGKDEITRLSVALDETVTELRSYIGDISHVLTQMSEKNFAVSSSVEYHGDFLPIKAALEKIVSSISLTFREISQSAGQIRDGSAQLSAGAQSVSQSTVEEAAAVEQLTASVNHMAEHINHNADNAQNAARLSRESEAETTRSNEQMSSMLASMEEINNSSNEIAKIIKVIEDIAFQTNILALNAAVEAARAGAAGKGFAVVADEVRNLAAKSAEAAQNTTKMIGQSIASVKNGADIAEETAKSMQAVVEKVQQVRTLVDGIASATDEQAVAVRQVNNGMQQITSSIQTNSATAEESAAASEELASQAELLKNLMDEFRHNELAAYIAK